VKGRNEYGADDERGKRAEEHHLADRIERNQPFRERLEAANSRLAAIMKRMPSGILLLRTAAGRALGGALTVLVAV
jgi:hypothetical protein